MIKRIHCEKFSYVRMTDIEKEQEGLLAIMDAIQDFNPDKSENFDGYLRWKIMGRLKAKARFQRQYDDRAAAYDSIVETGEDDKMMTGESRLVLMDYQKYEESGALAAEEYVWRKFVNSSVRAAVAGLPAREREFISWVYGLNGGGYHTMGPVSRPRSKIFIVNSY